MNVSRQVMLCEMANKFGDFLVSRIKLQPDGTIKSTKWRSVHDCWHSDEGLRFLNQATDMTAPACMVYLDFDSPNKETLNHALQICKEYRFKYWAYRSGGRGFHVHVLIPELAMTSIHSTGYRKKLRRLFINKCKAELLKASEKSMILIPGAPNRKTGKPKVLLEAWP